MTMPNLPSQVTPAARDAIYTSLGLSPGMTLSVQITEGEVEVQFVACDEAGRLIRSSGTNIVHVAQIPVQDA